MGNFKKSLNLIALTVFLGSNLLTPISYAIDDLEGIDGPSLESVSDSENVGNNSDSTGGGRLI